MYIRNMKNKLGFEMRTELYQKCTDENFSTQLQLNC